MEKVMIERITRVYRRRPVRNTPKGKILGRAYWQGSYQEDGRQITVYVGKELPKELRRLITKRYRKPGYRNYTWPRPTGMWKAAQERLAMQGTEGNED